jgi:hypothetical protein
MSQEAQVGWYKAGTLIFAIGFFWVCSAMCKIAQELVDTQQEVRECKAALLQQPIKDALYCPSDGI